MFLRLKIRDLFITNNACFQKEEFANSIRLFVEECDNFQGFQVFADVDSAFGATAEDLLLEVTDEYTKKPI